MTLQFIQDNRGNTTGVFIPIEEWQLLKTKYTDLEEEELDNVVELSLWQKEIIEKRLKSYYKHAANVSEFDSTLDDIENTI